MKTKPAIYYCCKFPNENPNDYDQWTGKYALVGFSGKRREVTIYTERYGWAKRVTIGFDWLDFLSLSVLFAVSVYQHNISLFWFGLSLWGIAATLTTWAAIKSVRRFEVFIEQNS